MDRSSFRYGPLAASLLLLTPALIGGPPGEGGVEMRVAPSALVVNTSGDWLLEMEGDFAQGDYVDWIFGGARIESGWTAPQVTETNAPGFVASLSPYLSVQILPVQATSGPDRGLRVSFITDLPPGTVARISMRLATVGQVAHARSLEANYFRPSAGSLPLQREFFASEPGPATALHMAGPTVLVSGEAVEVSAAAVDEFLNPADAAEQDLPIDLVNLSTGTITPGFELDLDAGRGMVEVGPVPAGAYQLRTAEGAALPGVSAPFLVSLPAGNPPNILWGDLHVHGEFSNDALTMGWGELTRYARDVAHLDFVAATDHDGGLDEDPSNFSVMSSTVLAEETPEFIPFPGFEWTSSGPNYSNRPQDHVHSWGHRQVLFRDPLEAVLIPSGHPMSSQDFPDFVTEMELAAPSGWLAIPHHLGAPFYRQWVNGGPWWGPILDVPEELLLEHCSVAEVYSALGSQESRASEDPWRPTKSAQEELILAQGQPTRRFRDACADEKAFGVVGTSDGHHGYPGLGIDRKHRRGLTAVYSQPGRDAIFDGLVAHRTYATSGPRIALIASLGGRLPGATLNHNGSGTLLSLKVAAPAPLERVLLVRNGVDVMEWDTDDFGESQAIELNELLSIVPGVYYVRIEQAPDSVEQDGERAWTSPWKIE